MSVITGIFGFYFFIFPKHKNSCKKCNEHNYPDYKDKISDHLFGPLSFSFRLRNSLIVMPNPIMNRKVTKIPMTNTLLIFFPFYFVLYNKIFKIVAESE